MKTYQCVLCFLAAAASALSQPAANFAGHWSGTFGTPEIRAQIVVDLAQNAKKEWIGSVSLPQIGPEGMPISAISVQGNVLRFSIPSIPGESTFEGTIAKDGGSIAGRMGSTAGTFYLKRVGSANVKVPPPNSMISKDLEGTWEATLHGELGTSFRIVLKLTRRADGLATGTVRGPYRPTEEIPITSITQTGNGVRLVIGSTSTMAFAGSLEGNGELKGIWNDVLTDGSQVTFRRAAK
jgi:hypothetical protein